MKIVLCIWSDCDDVGNILKKLEVQPTYFYNKGDKAFNGIRLIQQSHSYIEISSESFVKDNSNIDEHIKYMKKLLLPKVGKLQVLKERNDTDIALNIYVNVDSGELDFAITNKNLKFIMKISNWIGFAKI